MIRRNGKRPPLHERDGIAKKDTILLGPNDEVDVFLRFRDYPGPFVFHCHNADKTQHGGLVVYGNEATGKWSAIPGMLKPSEFVRAVLRVV